MKRMVIVRLDDLVEMIKDYVGEEHAPVSARYAGIMRNPKYLNKIGIMVVSDDWNGWQGVQELHFDLRRVYGLAG